MERSVERFDLGTRAWNDAPFHLERVLGTVDLPFSFKALKMHNNLRNEKRREKGYVVPPFPVRRGGIGVEAGFSIGAERDVDGQTYRCVELRPHTKRDGTETKLAAWQTRCATCGAEFIAMTPNDPAGRFEPSRRCAEHKRPGVYVNRARWAEVCRQGRA